MPIVYNLLAIQQKKGTLQADFIWLSLVALCLPVKICSASCASIFRCFIRFFYKMNMSVDSLHHLYRSFAAEIENIGFNRFWRLLSAGVLAEPFHFIEVFHGSFVD